MKKLTIALLLVAGSARGAVLSHWASQPRITTTQDRILATWTEFADSRIRFAMLDRRGAEVKSGDIAIASSSMPNVTIATDGSNFLAVWEQGDRVGREAHYALIDPHGTTSSIITVGTLAGAKPLPVNYHPQNYSSPVVTWDGTRYLIFWVDADYNAEATAVSAEGAMGDTFFIHEMASVFSAVSHDGVTGIACEEHSQGFDDVTFAEINGTTVTKHARVAWNPDFVGFGSPLFGLPMIAWNGAEYYIVWQVGRTGRYEGIAGTRVSARWRAAV